MREALTLKCVVYMRSFDFGVCMSTCSLFLLWSVVHMRSFVSGVCSS